MRTNFEFLRRALAALLLLAAGAGLSARADDGPALPGGVNPAKLPDKPTSGDKNAEPNEVKPSPEEKRPEVKPGQPSLLDKLSKELFKEIDDGSGKPAAAEKENKLERAATGMRTAGEKLDESVTGDETRKIQEQVIRDLDDLIKQMQNPPPPPQGGGGGSSSSGGGKNSSAGASAAKSGQPPSKPGGQQEKPQSSQGAESHGGAKEKETAEGSEERREAARKGAEEAARKKKMEMDVWGHLPPHLREQLLNTYGERMLPKYEALVKQFYEALSEQGEPPRR